MLSMSFQPPSTSSQFSFSLPAFYSCHLASFHLLSLCSNRPHFLVFQQGECASFLRYITVTQDKSSLVRNGVTVSDMLLPSSRCRPSYFTLPIWHDMLPSFLPVAQVNLIHHIGALSSVTWACTTPFCAVSDNAGTRRCAVARAVISTSH
jgi:hypothetical protein